MKKLFFVFVIGAFAACGNGNSDSTTDPTSTTASDTTGGINDTSRMSSGSTTGATGTDSEFS